MTDTATRSPGLVEACADPQLFALDPWPRQREILDAIDSGRYREVILALGRRSGKSLMAAAVAVHDACFRDLTPHLRPREPRHVVCVAASREQAAIVLNFARGLLSESPLLAPTIEAETSDSITVRQPATGAPVTIKTVPCSARTTRGLAVSTLIADELAHWMDATEGPAVADRVYRALSPSVAQFGAHGRILAISTPWGRSGLFHELFSRAESGARPHALAIQAPTWEVNPTLDAEFYDDERARDPDTYRGEFGAEFLASGGAFLEWSRIEAAVADDRLELPPGRDYMVGPIAAIDVAFARDPFALSIVGRDPIERGRLRLACVRSWKPSGGELDVETVLDEVAEIAKRYGAGRVYCDQYCSTPVRQSLGRRGLSATEITMLTTSKTKVYSTLKSKLYAGELELYRDEGLLAELGRVEAHYTAGAASVRIPRVGGSHGDLAQSLALAVYALRTAPANPDRGAVGGGARGYTLAGVRRGPISRTDR